jgi:hypothetical protein
MACWRHVCNLSAYDPCCYCTQFQEVCYQKHTNLRLQWPSGQCETEWRLWWTRRSLLFWCKDMSACIIYSTKTCQLKRYHTHFQEVVIRSIPISYCSGQCEWHGSGRVMAGERHGNSMVCVNRSLKRQGNGMGTAWERHGMCESVFKTAGERHGMCESAFNLLGVVRASPGFLPGVYERRWYLPAPR